MDSAKHLQELSKIYLEAVYGKSPEQVEAERRKKDDLAGSPLIVTNADKKANTKAYQNLKAGKKGYKAADHLGEGKKAKKDFDGDGQLESPEAEYKGSKDKAIKKELKDLQKAANTLKGINVAKADVVPGVGYKEETILEKQKDTPKQVAAVIDYYRSKKGTGEAVKDTEEGKTKEAKQERDYAAWERSKMKKDDPNWKHKKGSTSESVEAEKYIETVQQIKKAELEDDIKRWNALKESGQFSEEELKNIIWNEGLVAPKGVDSENEVNKATRKAAFRPFKNTTPPKLKNEGYQRDPEGGEEKERQRRRSQKGGDTTEKVRGERTPMPPRGDKRREEFERWYAANVR